MHNWRRAFIASLAIQILIIPAWLIASSVGVLVEFHPGAPIVAAEVNGNFAALRTAIDDGDQRMRALENGCPRLVLAETVREYERDPMRTDIVRCTRGDDEMVKVGDFWIDRYEASLVDAAYWNGGACDGASSATIPYGSMGADPEDDYPTTFPDNGNFTAPVYACSVADERPSRKMTWFQAQQACALAGKRLCTNAEWQAAVAGTADPGDVDGTEGGPCHTGGRLGVIPRSTGNAAACVSRWGAEDMIGNVDEWVADWMQAGVAWQGSNDGSYPLPRGGASDGPWAADYERDQSFNINGRAWDGVWQDGLPAALHRGGNFESGVWAGAFAVSAYHAPSASNAQVGARCCAR